MAIESVLLLIPCAFMCFAAGFAFVARSAALDARVVTREVRSAINALELETTRHASQIKRLTSSVGALGRWNGQKAEPADPDALPDPASDPERWRDAVRRRAFQLKQKAPKGELQ